MSPNLLMGEPVAELKPDPKLRAALDASREKIRRRCQSQCEVLRSNLQIILTDFCDAHAISSISWSGPADEVPPAFALDLLAARLAERLADLEYERFLSRFSAELIERTAIDCAQSQ
jgi:hypothetical protein